VASISKFVTAAGILLLSRKGLLPLDADVGELLAYPVRAGGFDDVPITVRMLLSHTSSVRDSEAYLKAIESPTPLEALLRADVYTGARPGTAFEYTNLGFGMLAAVAERACGAPFDLLMRDSLFGPAGVSASYWPQRAQGTLADAWRLMPPARRPNYDAAKRQARPIPEPEMDPARDYLSAHGSLCVTAGDLVRIAQYILSDRALFDQMSAPVVPFGRRDPTLSQGLGCFIYRDPALPWPLYGHQGLAYGAVHGLFFRDGPVGSTDIRGFALLTSAVSEQREGVIARINRDVARVVFG